MFGSALPPFPNIMIFTFWILYPIAKAADRPDLVLRGGAIYTVIWLGITITLHMMR